MVRELHWDLGTISNSCNLRQVTQAHCASVSLCRAVPRITKQLMSCSNEIFIILILINIDICIDKYHLRS